jgi:LPXTG-motif cell wall-anchored protein
MSLVDAATPVTFELRTDENGRYDFSSLPYGRYTLTYTLPGDVLTTYEPEGSEGRTIIIVINKPKSEANVGGVGQSTLKALVREQDGTLYPNTPFWMRWWGSDRQFNTPDDVIILTTTNSESMVEFIGNLPSGRYRVEVPGGGFLAKVTTTLDLLPIASLTDSEFVFRKLSFDYTLLAMLPDTGAGIAGLLMSASVLLLGGGALVASDRRRRRVRVR